MKAAVAAWAFVSVLMVGAPLGAQTASDGRHEAPTQAAPPAGEAPAPGGTVGPDAQAAPPEGGIRAPGDAARSLTDPQPAPSAPDTLASEARIRAMLEKQGYSNIQNIRREGEGYVASATRGGEAVTVRVDPQLGQIDEHGGR